MWLRMATANYEFIFCPSIAANYRIVSTSMVRTILRNPSADRSYTEFMLRDKCWHSQLQTASQRKFWAQAQWDEAYALYAYN